MARTDKGQKWVRYKSSGHLIFFPNETLKAQAAPAQAAQEGGGKRRREKLSDMSVRRPRSDDI